MKNWFLLLILSCFFSASVTAQNISVCRLYKGNVFDSVANDTNVIGNTHINPASNETWWGYFDGDVSNAKGVGAGGFSEPGITYDCAIFIPGDCSMGKGRIIKAVRFYFASAKNINNVKVWLSKKLPNSAEEADIQIKAVSYNEITDGAVYDDPENDVAFDTPYVIDDSGVYVGYSFTMDAIESMQDMLPVVTSINPDNTEKNAGFISFGWGWEDMSTKEGMGNLALRVLMEGDFKDDMVEAGRDFENVYCVKNSVAEIPVSLINMGGNGLDNLSYKVTVDGIEFEEETVKLNSHVDGIGTKFSFNMPVKMNEFTGMKTVKVEITKVNGNENKSLNKIVCGNVLCLSEFVTRKVVLEEYTGTWAEWAPRSFVGLEKAELFYGDEIVITSSHFGEDDPMKCEDYVGMHSDYAPDCNVSREIFSVDSYYGSYVEDVWGMAEIIDDLRKVPAIAKIKAEGVISSVENKIIANSYTTFLYNGDVADYSLAYVLKADGLHGDTEEWIQNNVLCTFTNGEFDFDPLFAKWVNSASEIKDMRYNDVAIATKGIKNGIEGSVVVPVVEGDVQKHMVEFDLNQIGNRIQNEDKLFLCVYLLDNNNGRIINADCKKVIDEADSSVRDIEYDTNRRVAERYSVDGRKLKSPVRGLNIVKYADGTTSKVWVK